MKVLPETKIKRRKKDMTGSKNFNREFMTVISDIMFQFPIYIRCVVLRGWILVEYQNVYKVSYLSTFHLSKTEKRTKHWVKSVWVWGVFWSVFFCKSPYSFRLQVNTDKKLRIQAVLTLWNILKSTSYSIINVETFRMSCKSPTKT